MKKTRLNLGAGSGRALALSEAGKSRDANLLMALAERFNEDRELHLVIMRNPAAANAPEVLGTIEHTCRSVLLKLPFVQNLMLLAKDTQNDDQLAGFVLSPLKVVRMMTCFNPRIGHLLQTAHDDAVRAAIPANRRLLDAEKTRDFLKALDLGSGERPQSIATRATPVPPTRSISPVPPTSVRTPPAPAILRQLTPPAPTAPSQPTSPGRPVIFKDHDGGVPAINLHKRDPRR